MTGVAPNTIYPQYCFHLSPTIEKWCRFRARNIHALTSHRGFEGQDLYFHLNHPIKWVQVAGVVVAIDEFYGKRSYTIDDSSGATIECLLNVPKEKANLAGITETAAEGTVPGKDKKGNKVKTSSTGNASTQEGVKPIVDGDIDVGDVLLVKGNVTIYRNNKQIRVYKISHLRSTEEEVQFWKRMTEFHDDVLSKPWVLSEKELKHCRKEATRSGYAEPKEPNRSKRKAGGLERTTVNSIRPVKSSLEVTGAKKVKYTGLERTTIRLDSVATGLEPGSNIESRSKSNTSRSSASVSDAKAVRKTRVSGLERVTKRSESVECEPSIFPPPAITSTATTVRPSKRKLTGLEKGATHHAVDSSSRSSAKLPDSDRRAHRKPRMTGLEKGLHLVTTSQAESVNDTEERTIPPARSRRHRPTGLERKTRPIKTIHVEEEA